MWTGHTKSIEARVWTQLIGVSTRSVSTTSPHSSAGVVASPRERRSDRTTTAMHPAANTIHSARSGQGTGRPSRSIAPGTKSRMSTASRLWLCAQPLELARRPKMPSRSHAVTIPAPHHERRHHRNREQCHRPHRGPPGAAPPRPGDQHQRRRLREHRERQSQADEPRRFPRVQHAPGDERPTQPQERSTDPTRMSACTGAELRAARHEGREQHQRERRIEQSQRRRLIADQKPSRRDREQHADRREQHPQAPRGREVHRRERPHREREGRRIDERVRALLETDRARSLGERHRVVRRLPRARERAGHVVGSEIGMRGRRFAKLDAGGRDDEFENRERDDRGAEAAQPRNVARRG